MASQAPHEISETVQIQRCILKPKAKMASQAPHEASSHDAMQKVNPLLAAVGKLNDILKTEAKATWPVLACNRCCVVQVVMLSACKSFVVCKCACSVHASHLLCASLLTQCMQVICWVLPVLGLCMPEYAPNINICKIRLWTHTHTQLICSDLVLVHRVHVLWLK